MPLPSVSNGVNAVKGEWAKGDTAIRREVARFAKRLDESGPFREGEKKPATPKKLEVAGLMFLSRFIKTTQNCC